MTAKLTADQKQRMFDAVYGVLTTHASDLPADKLVTIASDAALKAALAIEGEAEQPRRVYCETCDRERPLPIRYCGHPRCSHRPGVGA